MRNKIVILVVVAVVLVVGVVAVFLQRSSSDVEPEVQVVGDGVDLVDGSGVRVGEEVEISALAHATMVMNFGGAVFYVDPTGGAEHFAGEPEADVVLVTDIHGDHMDTETLEEVVGGAVLIVPQAVADELPESLGENLLVLANGESTAYEGFLIEAVPMYNLPESEESFHVKGRGNGYVIEGGGRRVYVAGDTAGIAEMRELVGIDVAFVPMNLPFTMSVEDAADAVLEFAPARVYPYHYRGQEGLSDVELFAQIVSQGNPDIQVVQLDWYGEG